MNYPLISLTSAILYLATFIYSAIAIYLLIVALLKPEGRWLPRVAALSLGIGPLVISWLLTVVMAIWEGANNTFYISVILFLLTIFVAAGIKSWRSIPQLYRDLFYKNHIPTGYPFWLGVGALVVIMVAMLGHAVFLPMIGNDPLEYAQSARLVYEQRSSAGYPFIDTSQSGGYYGPWSHPMGHTSLLVWGFLIQGSAEYAGVIKIMGPVYAFATVILVSSMMEDRIQGVWAALLLICTPLYYIEVVNIHVDSMRIFTFLAAFVAVMYLLEHSGFRNLIFTGVMLGSAIFSHSIGILVLPMFAVIYWFKKPQSLSISLRQIIIVCLIALTPVAPRIVDNIIVFGSPISDEGAVPAWSIPDLRYPEYYRKVRNIDTVDERILYGAFKGFSDIKLFGISYWLLLLAVIISLSRIPIVITSLGNIRKRTITVLETVVFVSILYWGGMMVSIIMGLDVFIKNPRYLMTIQPFVAILTVVITSRAMRYQRKVT